jgi:hypothetical protein
MPANWRENGCRQKSREKEGESVVVLMIGSSFVVISDCRENR